ncbi:MAG: IS256 family transposase [Candidatus Omnitrophota bacterium]|nr:IS256 family transposase [Candidatus Omnitrophota bacterium]
MPTAQLDFEKNIAGWWREVKDDFWGDVKQETLKLVRLLLEESMKEELVVYTQAQWHEYTGQARPYRNGSYTRALSTALGVLPDLRVPRSREGGFHPTVLPRYQRRQEAVNGLLRETFLAGVSTRRVGEVVQPLLGVRWSATTVSTVTKTLDAAVHQFQRRALLDEYQVLVLDGVTRRVKDALGVKKRLVLVAYGLTVFGQRVLLSFRQAPSESATAWEAFLNDLYRRGLEGTNLRLVVTDGCKGLHAALAVVFPYVTRQRCWAHKLRNVASRLPRRLQAAALQEAKTISQAPTRREAVTRFQRWARHWQATAPTAVACLREDLEELLPFLDFPTAQRVKLRTTNVIERCFREVRRRTRPIGCFTNAASCDRIIYAVFHRLNTLWQDRPLRQFTHFT